VFTSAVTVPACDSSVRPSARGHSRTASLPLLDAPYAKRGPYEVGISAVQGDARQIVVLYPASAGSEHGRPRATYDGREATRDPSGPPLAADPSSLLAIDAYRDVPVAAGRFPVILFSHGYGAVPLLYAALETRLAAWGFVVIAPDHRERDTVALLRGRAHVDDRADARTLVRALRAVAATPRFGAHLQLGRVAAVGHSQGGGTALAALSLPEVVTAVAWASTPPMISLPAKPVMLIGANHDLGFGTAVQRRIYEELHGPGRLALLGSGAGHASFMDLCARAHDRRSLRSSSIDTIPTNRLLALAVNGCHPDEVDPRDAWEAIVHFTVAQLRAVFHIDPRPIGLDSDVTGAFPKITITYEAS
jgi:dienelactone hydrolase